MSKQEASHAQDATDRLIAAAREWVTERNPKDAAEKALFAAVFRAFPEDAHTRESCDCGGDCDECPPAAQVEAWLQECEAAKTLTFPDGLGGARKEAMRNHASMLPDCSTPADGESEIAWLRNAYDELKAMVVERDALVEGANARLRQLKDSIDTRINNLLCETKPNYDDSIVGINDAWDVVRKACDEYIAMAERTQ